MVLVLLSGSPDRPCAALQFLRGRWEDQEPCRRPAPCARGRASRGGWSWQRGGNVFAIHHQHSGDMGVSLEKTGLFIMANICG